MVYTIGIDGGGTKTAGVLTDDEGHILASARGESTNFNAVGHTAAKTHLHQVIRQLLTDAHLDAEAVSAIGLGIGGVSRAPDQALIQGWAAEVLPGVPAFVDNDAIMALAAASEGDLYGIVVVCGTGMIVNGINRAGQRQRAAGWGALLGDVGSGYWIAMAALQAVTQAADEIIPPTRLTGALLNTLQLDEVGELEHWAYAEYNWARFAALAPVVNRCAVEGDPASRQILDEAAQGIAAAIVSVARRLGMLEMPFPLVFAGGILQEGLVADRLAYLITSQLPAARIDRRFLDPAVGAAKYARTRMNARSSPDR